MFADVDDRLCDILDGAAQYFEPTEIYSALQWASARRHLSPETCDKHGPWRAEETPWIPEILDAFMDPDVEMIVMQKSTQAAWTDGVVLNLIGYTIDIAPCPALVMFPTVPVAKRFMKLKFMTMARDTPSVGQKLRAGLVARGARGSSTLAAESRPFPGGNLEVVGSNSPANIADMPIRVVIIEEPDRCGDTANRGRNAKKSEGPSIDLVIRRTTTFANRKIVLGGSPTFSGKSAIERYMQQTDKRRMLIPCPECGTMQTLVWSNVVWDHRPGRAHPEYGDALPETARYRCSECEVRFDNDAKVKALQRLEWRPTAEFTGKAGFYFSELYSSFPNSTLADVVAGRLRADQEKRKGDEGPLQVWHNTVLGETFEQQRGDVVDLNLAGRREDFRGVVPQGVRFVTMGVDVQGNRLEIETVGWGHLDESWGLAYTVIPFIPAEEDWSELLDLYEAELTTETGSTIGVDSMCIDSGNWTSEVYAFVRANPRRNIFAVKGSVSVGSTTHFERSERTRRRPIDLYILGVNALKDRIYADLAREEPGARYCHISALYPSDWERQMQTETKQVRYRNGKAQELYVKRTNMARNEAVDCRVYATAARLIRGKLADELLGKPRRTRARSKTSEPQASAAPASRRRSFIDPRGTWSR